MPAISGKSRPLAEPGSEVCKDAEHAPVQRATPLELVPPAENEEEHTASGHLRVLGGTDAGEAMLDDKCELCPRVFSVERGASTLLIQLRGDEGNRGGRAGGEILGKCRYARSPYLDSYPPNVMVRNPVC